MSKSLKIVSDAPPETEASGPVEKGDFAGRAAIVTLGCAKNKVDSEVMLGLLERGGYEIVNDVTDADVVVVNTCSFLQSAVEESIDAILDVSDLKEEGRLRQLVVTGCLVSRYKEELEDSLPEVDAFLTTDEVLEITNVVDGDLPKFLKDGARPYFLYDDTLPRELTDVGHSAYVKISEGCDRPCTFCIIPKIRGPMRSRELDSVLREVENLAERGVREINLVGQDLTAYGQDRKAANLAVLLQEIDGLKVMDWVRLLYTYPLGINGELLDAVGGLKSVCNYIDLPLQHSSEAVLKRMKRPLGKFSPRKLVPFMRDRQPGIHLRTTFIVGFPGETEEDITDLERFILEGHFTSVGVFTYSPEPESPAAELDGAVAEEERHERRERLMLAQKAVNDDRMADFVGQELDVLLDGVHPESDMLLTGRTSFQAPEVDGTVIITDSEVEQEVLRAGAMLRVEITETAGYDLVGKVKRTTAH